eukprot:CAMPEP_0114697566 /NCGR_PEP_ID=MMETSP0191-20121206/73936_1 /TAXON_ID=126664 /ORGANISM="Sorites sp." /LENGTH=91 /DNA_ID=CAMNT_0001996837 /DNA_START=141 /DNA_END=412 /DNA_ORIENTATION=-
MIVTRDNDDNIDGGNGAAIDFSGFNGASIAVPSPTSSVDNGLFNENDPRVTMGFNKLDSNLNDDIIGFVETRVDVFVRDMDNLDGNSFDYG